MYILTYLDSSAVITASTNNEAAHKALNVGAASNILAL